MMTDLFFAFDYAWIRFAFGFIIGAVLGSFGTMLAYRLPRRLSIISPRSHCPTCKTVLEIRDLVPIFSWLMAKGHCRHCKAIIGSQYVAIEIVTSFFCAITTVLIGFSSLLVPAYGVIVAAIVFYCIKRIS